jgi:hypothetical protein
MFEQLSAKIKKNSANQSGAESDFTSEMLNFFVRLEVQRRYFNIVSVEMLSKSFGMKQPSSMDTLMDRNTRINLDRLIKNGRSITIDNYLQARDELDANPAERKELLNDRETFIVRPKQAGHYPYRERQ